MKTLGQSKCRPLPPLATTSVVSDGVRAPSDANIGWVSVLFQGRRHNLDQLLQEAEQLGKEGAAADGHQRTKEAVQV